MLKPAPKDKLCDQTFNLHSQKPPNPQSNFCKVGIYKQDVLFFFFLQMQTTKTSDNVSSTTMNYVFNFTFRNFESDSNRLFFFF